MRGWTIPPALQCLEVARTTFVDVADYLASCCQEAGGIGVDYDPSTYLLSFLTRQFACADATEHSAVLVHGWFPFYGWLPGLAIQRGTVQLSVGQHTAGSGGADSAVHVPSFVDCQFTAFLRLNTLLS